MSLTIKQVHKVICNYYQLDVLYFFNKSRKRTFIDPRQQFHFLSKEYTKLSFADIGLYLKEETGVFYDHATVMHSRKAIKNYLETDKKTKNDITNLRKMLDDEDIKKESTSSNLWYKMYLNMSDSCTI